MRGWSSQYMQPNLPALVLLRKETDETRNVLARLLCLAVVAST